MELLNSWPFKIGIFCALLVLRLVMTLMQKPSAAEAALNASGEKKDEGGWLETIDSLLITIGLVFFIVQPFILQPFYIPSGSMEPTLQFQPVSDRLLVSKAIYFVRDPVPGDVVVFRPPSAAAVANPTTNLNDDFIKRCIGAPGDVVYAWGNRTFIRNGKTLIEPYVKWSPGITPDGQRHNFAYDMKILDGKVYSREYSLPGVAGEWQCEGQVVPFEEQERITVATPEAVPPGRYLMLGDHRNNSSDGHVWGFVPRENIVGKAMCVFWPPQRLGTLDRISFLNSATLQPDPQSKLPAGPQASSQASFQMSSQLSIATSSTRTAANP